MSDEDEDFELVDRLFFLARKLTPMVDWVPLLVEAGLDPSEVEVIVRRKRWRKAPAVLARHTGSGSSCESVGDDTVEENAAGAIAGLVSLLEEAAGP